MDWVTADVIIDLTGKSQFMCLGSCYKEGQVQCYSYKIRTSFTPHVPPKLNQYRKPKLIKLQKIGIINKSLDIKSLTRFLQCLYKKIVIYFKERNKKGKIRMLLIQ